MNTQKKENFSLRLTKEEKDLFTKLAESQGISLSEFIRQSTLEKSEDLVDLKYAKEIMEKVERGEEETYPISSLHDMLWK